MIAIAIVFISQMAHTSNIPPQCRDWFLKGKVSKQDCVLECSILKLGLGTSSCPGYCKRLCIYHEGDSFLKQIIYYPGLNPKEMALVKKKPLDAIIAFIQKERAEYYTSRSFPNSQFNDEADAFRHFLWAGLMTFEIGEDLSERFLNAHESSPAQPRNEKAMDLANNRAGILAALKLKKIGLNNLDELLKLGLTELRKQNLVVLNPGLNIPKEPM